MRQCAADVGHVFANRLGSRTRGNVSCDKNNYYSYSTVFAQWLDDNVVLLYEGATSPSSSRHKLYKGMFADNVHVFSYSDGHRYYHGCDLIGYSGYSYKFNYIARVRLLDYWIGELYNSFAYLKDATTNGADKFDVMKYWGQVNELCSLYKDTTVKKWLRIKSRTSEEWVVKKKMVRALMETQSVPEVLDKMYGDGTWQRYYDFCAKFRKAKSSRKKIMKIARYLGINDPYCKYAEYSPGEVRSFTAEQRLRVKFAVLAKKEWEKGKNERDKRERKSYAGWFKWITGAEPVKIKSLWCSEEIDGKVTTCRNMYTGEEYHIINMMSNYSYNWNFPHTSRLDFSDFKEFRVSENKRQWIEEFYADTKEAADNTAAQNILSAHHCCIKGDGYFDRVYELKDNLKNEVSADEYELCKRYVEKQDRYYVEEEARKRALQMRKAAEKERKRKEEELRKKVTAEKIRQYESEGVEGSRKIWREHLGGINKYNDELFYGGNVLLRLSVDKRLVETSMNIRLDIDVCKKFFKIIEKWHENPKSFKQIKIKTHFCGEFTIVSYENDILTAGCHKIAFCEMQRMYNELLSLEKVA